jgi:hypothetical protein
VTGQVSTMNFIKLLKLMEMNDPTQSMDNAMCSEVDLCVLWAYTRPTAPMIISALAPLVIAADVAGVSSMCDRLYQKVNGLRLHWPQLKEADAIHAKTFPLLFTLERLSESTSVPASRMSRQRACMHI